MRKEILSMESNEKYEVIKRLAEGHISKSCAAIKIGCTIRTVNRLLKKYQIEGKSAFVHGNTGRKPLHAFTEQQQLDIITIYNNKYRNTNFTYCCELLRKHDSIQIAPSALRTILLKEFILSPRATKKTKEQMKKNLKNQHKEAATQTEKS